MGSLFDLDAPIWVWMGEVADVIILALLWWICCIPVVTIGASTTAVFYVMGKKVRKESVYVCKDFFKSFKRNFKQSIPITIIMIVAYISVGLYIFMIVENVLSGDAAGQLKWILPIAILFAFETLNVFTYIWAILSRFDMKTSVLIKTALILTHRHLLTTIAITAIFGIVGYLVLRMPFLLVLAPGIIVAGASFLLQALFTVYIEEDRKAHEVSEEAIEEELIEEELIEETLEENDGDECAKVDEENKRETN